MSCDLERQAASGAKGGAFSASADERRKPDSRTRIVVAIVVLAAMTGTALWANWARQRRIDAVDGLLVRETDLDFATVWSRDTLPWTVQVENTSDQCIEIADVRLSCGCASITPKSMTLQPGESGEFQLTLDLRPNGAAEAREPERNFVVQMFPVIRGITGDRVCWTIRGSVRKAFEVSVVLLDFGDSLTVGLPFAQKTFRARCLLPDSELVAECDESLAAVETVRLNEKLQEYEVRVRPTATLPVGRQAFAVLLRAVPRGCAGAAVAAGTAPEMRVDVLARVYAEVRAMPEDLLLGGGKVGDTLQEVVTLSSTGRPFEVRRIECRPFALLVEPLDANDGTPLRCSYRVHRRVDGLGIRHGEIRFFVSTAGSDGTQVVCVPVACEGFAEEETTP